MHSPLPPSDTAPNFDPCDLYRDCTLCPRMCHANRYVRTGICGCGPEIRAARAALHFWEEPCISGQDGSGAVFFSGCTLKCCYCQNYPISRGEVGKAISQERLEEIFLELQDQGARNIDLITATQFLPSILPVLEKVRGYERVETLRMLEGYVDVYLPDLKYFSSQLSGALSGAPDYFLHASAALSEMIRQTGTPVFDKNKMLVRGTLIRHMVLPGQKEDSIRLLH